ncbi:hypothetical protein AN958_06027 [Leucoagaricus sp. SymC.cos]|nr:hypothetical protein AN958_06027 [Leucoagaricus sp. SymC.cos]
MHILIRTGGRWKPLSQDIRYIEFVLGSANTHTQYAVLEVITAIATYIDRHGTIQAFVSVFHHTTHLSYNAPRLSPSPTLLTSDDAFGAGGTRLGLTPSSHSQKCVAFPMPLPPNPLIHSDYIRQALLFRP